jgi:hypothetical protein
MAYPHGASKTKIATISLPSCIVQARITNS